MDKNEKFVILLEKPQKSASKKIKSHRRSRFHLLPTGYFLPPPLNPTHYTLFSKLVKNHSKLLKNNKKSVKICEICVKTFNFLKKFGKIFNLLARLAEKNLRFCHKSFIFEPRASFTPHFQPEFRVHNYSKTHRQSRFADPKITIKLKTFPALCSHNATLPIIYNFQGHRTNLLWNCPIIN